MGPQGSAVLRAPAGVDAVRKSLEVIAYRALRTGRGPAPVIERIAGQGTGRAVAPNQHWRLAREIADELAPGVHRRMTARAESVTGGDTVVW